MRPNFREEKRLWTPTLPPPSRSLRERAPKGYKRVAGLDEAGRGCLAGPVVAAAVTVNAKFKMQNAKVKFKTKNLSNLKVKDSKQLSPKKREELYKIITKHPQIKWGIGKVSEKVIDQINIKNAAELAMEKALKNLEKKLRKKADFLIIDGNRLKNYKLKTKNYKLIIKADGKVFSCASASIIAKVWRDAIMKREAKKYPQYGFDTNKGYPTKFHRKMLKKYGPCKIHRYSYRPVKSGMLK